MNEYSTELIPVRLPNGTIIKVEANIAGEEAVSTNVFDFDCILTAIKGIAESLVPAVSDIGPDKTQIEFSLQASLETGSLIAALVKGGTNANLRVTLEWDCRRRSTS